MFSIIKKNEQKYLELNEARLKQAVNMMTLPASKMFQLVPVLLHYNNSSMPCFIEGDVPHGIVGFYPNESQQKSIEQFQTETNNFTNFSTDDESILALYCMGSTSSVGQGPKSDVDYWVCVSRHLSNDRIIQLEKKCLYIKNLSISEYGLEINFFIVKDNKFKEINNSVADAESCGTAQHMFLLDEFYRSAIHIAGQRLLWMVVPSEHEKDYYDYTKELFAKNILNRDEWLDLGKVGDIPSNEYYGSALWLLYKGADAPFKAVIKILLMECYSSEYPNTKLVSVMIKDFMHKFGGYSKEMDSYYMVYKKIYDYLKDRKEEERIKLLCSCFYVKISEGISNIISPTMASQRRHFIKELIDEWGWTSVDWEKLEKKSQKSIEEVISINKVIFNALMRSYRALLEFGERNNITDAINFTDMCVLSRKLHTIFDVYDGKLKIYKLDKEVTRIENDITYLNVTNSQVCKDGWYIFKKNIYEPREMIGQKSISVFKDLFTSIASSYFNNYIDCDLKTNIYIKSDNSLLSEKRVKQCVCDINSVFQDYKNELTNKTLLYPTEVTKMGLFINFSSDPTDFEEYTHVSRNIPNINIFTFGPKMKSMIGSIDLIITNTWNEVVCKHFEGDFSIFNFLTNLKKYFYIGKENKIEYNCFVYSKHLHNYIDKQVKRLLEQFLETISTRENKKKIITINNIDYEFYFENNNVVMKPVNDTNVQELSISEKLVNQTYDKVELPLLLQQYIMYGCRQFFIAKDDYHDYDIYEIDEKQRVKLYKGFSGSVVKLVQDITSFYSKKFDTESEPNIRFEQYFSLPQFFSVNFQNGEVKPLVI